MAALLEGVGAHLESALEAVRLQGMRVGEAFAQAMGQELRFDELDGRRDLWAAGAEPGGRGGDAAAAKPAEDGAEEGTGDNGADADADAGGEDDDDDDELQPYDLSDDEADLAPVAAPRYLRRLIERE